MVLKKADVASLRKTKYAIEGNVNHTYGVTEQFADREYVISALYDQSVDGDIPLTATPTAGIELDMTLPVGALVSEVFADILTAITASGGTATLDVTGIASSVTESDAVMVNNATEASLVAGALKFTTVNKKVTTATPVYLTAGTASFEKGKARIFVKYYMARD